MTTATFRSDKSSHLSGEGMGVLGFRRFAIAIAVESILVGADHLDIAVCFSRS
jgi:hypothetical protein